MYADQIVLEILGHHAPDSCNCHFGARALRKNLDRHNRARDSLYRLAPLPAQSTFRIDRNIPDSCSVELVMDSTKEDVCGRRVRWRVR